MTISRPVVSTVVVLALAVSALVGCGSESDDAGPALDPVTSVDSEPVPSEAAPSKPAPSEDTTSEDTDGASSGGASVVCSELQVVKDLSDEMSLATDEMLGTLLSSIGDADGTGYDDTEILAQLDAIASSLDRSLPDVLGAYRAAAELAEPEIAADIRLVADGTALLTPALVQVFADATTVEDLGAIDTVLAEPEFAEAATSAGLASLRLNDFTQPECGFRFSN